MTDTEICEAYFKALGWKPVAQTYVYLDGPTEDETCVKCGKHTPYEFEYWIDENGQRVDFIPGILHHYPAFREHVLERMGKEGWTVLIEDDMFFWIRLLPESECSHTPRHTEDTGGVEITDYHILRAAVLAATAYWKGKK